MADHEKAYVITMRGAHTAKIDDGNPFLVTITNPTNVVAPIVFFVGPKSPQNKLRELIRATLDKLLT